MRFLPIYFFSLLLLVGCSTRAPNHTRLVFKQVTQQVDENNKIEAYQTLVSNADTLTDSYGTVSCAYEYYRGSNVYCFPSYRVGLPWKKELKTTVAILDAIQKCSQPQEKDSKSCFLLSLKNYVARNGVNSSPIEYSVRYLEDICQPDEFWKFTISEWPTYRNFVEKACE